MNQSELKEMLTYDRETGEFRWINGNGRNVSAGDIAGSKTRQGYIRICTGARAHPRRYMAHRLAWLYEYGVMPAGQIDHVNRNKADNRIANLRVVDSAENRHNCEKQANNTSGVKGVYWHKKTKKWQANIMVRGRRIPLGYFESHNDAACVRKAAEKLYHPSFQP